MEKDKTKRLIEFYQTCQAKGYTDMLDDTQSLKAKVIASDMKLKYGDIVAFYEKAKQCYEQDCAEKEAANWREIQEARVSRKLIDIHGSKKGITLQVYLRPDGNFYTEFRGQKFEGVPKIKAQRTSVVLTTHHPSQAVYTGATVGGVSTGGVHYTKEGYSQKVTTSNRGQVRVNICGSEFVAETIFINKDVANRFKRDPLCKAGKSCILCYDAVYDATSYLTRAVTRKDYASQMNAASVAMNQRYLPYEECQEIAKLVNRILRFDLPPSDEEVYAEAVELAERDNSIALKRAIALFEQIKDFSDVAELLKEAEVKYEEVLQAEKERTILEKEARAEKNKKFLTRWAPLVGVLVIAGVLVFCVVRNNQMKTVYAQAMANLEEGRYQEAVAIFEEIPRYKDSSWKAKMYGAYQEALSAIERKDYLDAVEQMEALENCKNSGEMLSEVKYAVALLALEQGEMSDAYELFQELGDYKDAALYQYKWLKTSSIYTDHKNDIYQREEYEYDHMARVIRYTDYISRDDQGAVTEYSYDGGKMTSVTEGYWIYEKGRAQRQYPFTSTVEYDEKGNVSKKIDEFMEIKSNGKRILRTKDEYVYSRVYNADGTVASVTANFKRYTQGGGQMPKTETDTFTITYAYTCDSEGKTLKYTKTENGKVTEYRFTYDSEGKAIKYTVTSDGEIKEYRYVYDENGNVILMKSDDTETQYTYTQMLVKRDNE